MAGRIISLFPRTLYNCGNLAGGTSLEVVLVDVVDVGEFTEGTLIVRIHSNSSITGAAQLDVLLRCTAPSVEDPGVSFVDTSTALATASVTETTLTNKINVVRAQLSAVGGLVRVSIKASQDPAGPQSIQANLSAILVVKGRN